ncbi:MAG: DUF1097 domain-containing protein [Rhodocyclaceae bacterium]|jgi:hypothetical protein|nr:DUF1097 domain-containing protein [Rhodocyclaceae bacterium]MCP5233926.1 DUF1097 domain-containing protein [Zoogloeaceae bacterium]MCB1911036.1 DUF1097 domain-containing protein [Rhodocyclaceae bacterium]MCP5241136.1 DUF1097 domain-containing protein [Zoogloeaceae bacterium]MCP5254940.1 DUF1097 domain-containing protein [Zoogloeaceae bacterium]
MKFLHALAFSIALLVALWVYLSVGNPDFRFTPWIGFVAWAAYFAAGGGADGVRKSIAAGLAGALLTAVTLFGVQALGGSLIVLIGLVAILAFVLVAMADVPALAYTPAAFLGAACFFGSGAKLDASALFVCLTWCLGVLFGLLSEQIGKRLARPA